MWSSHTGSHTGQRALTEAEMCTSPCPIEGLEAARRQTCISGKGSGSWGADPEGAGGLLDWRIQQNDMGPQV